VAAGSDILDPDGNDVAATKLAVDCQIEHGEVTNSAFDLELRSNGPDVFRAQRRLYPGQLALVPGQPFMRRQGSIHLIQHDHTPRLQGGEHVPLVRHR